MRRRALSLGILVLGLFAMGVGAAVWGGANLLEESAPAPRATPAPTESPEKEAQVREILFQNEAVKGILAGRLEARDYWMQIDYVYQYREANNTGERPLAMVTMYFDPPLSWAGEVPTKSNPCQGHYQDDSLDPNDPCMNEPSQYGTAHRQFDQTTGITATVDLRRGQVVQVAPGGGGEYATKQAQRGYATPGTPEEDAKVRELVFQQQAVKTAVAGREEGRDYWVRILGYLYAPGEPITSDEKTLAIVDVYFDPPLSRFGDSFNVPGITADVDLRGGKVLKAVPGSPQPGDIQAAKERYAQ